MNKIVTLAALLAVRNAFQMLLDTYQIPSGTQTEIEYKMALDQLNTIIQTPDVEVAPVVVTQPIVSTEEVITGVLAGIPAPASANDLIAGVLAGLSVPMGQIVASISALTPAAPTPSVLAPSADQVAAAQAVIAAAAATAPAATAPATTATPDATATA